MSRKKTPEDREIAKRVGARIRQVRKIQRISQTRLAAEVGIRPGPLGWIEKGLHVPSGRLLYRIARQLNIRIDDLFQESNVWQAGAPSAADTAPVLLPPLGSAAGAEKLKSAHVVCQSVAGQLLALERLAGVRGTCGIPLHVPFPPTEAGAEQLAATVRQSLGIGTAIVRDYLELLEDAGLRVVFLDMPEGCESFCGYDHLNRNAFIFICSLLKKQPEHQTSRMLFELARVFWHARGTGGAAEAAAAGGTALDEEQFARRFAVCFLMPAEAVRFTAWRLGLAPEAWTWDMLLRLKHRYGVSARSFALRLLELDLCLSGGRKKGPGSHPFKSEIDAFIAGNGPVSEPGGNRPQLVMNGGLRDLMLRAGQRAGKGRKEVDALKRALCRNGVGMEG